MPRRQGRHRSGRLAQECVADALIVEPVVARDGGDGPGDHAAVYVHAERAPVGGWLLSPCRTVDTGDFVERGLLRVKPPFPEVSPGSAQVEAGPRQRREGSGAPRDREARIT